MIRISKEGEKRGLPKYKEEYKLILNEIDFKNTRKIRGEMLIPKTKTHFSEANFILPEVIPWTQAPPPICTITWALCVLGSNTLVRILPHKEPADVRYWEGKAQACLRRGKAGISWKAKPHGNRSYRNLPGKERFSFLIPIELGTEGMAVPHKDGASENSSLQPVRTGPCESLRPSGILYRLWTCIFQILCSVAERGGLGFRQTWLQILFHFLICGHL